MTILDIQEIEQRGDYFNAFGELLLLQKNNPQDLEIFLRTIFLNWYCLTLLINRPQDTEEKLLETLPELASYGITHFINEPDFLIVLGNLCSRFFFYLFGVTETFGEDICDEFIKKFPKHPIAELFSLQGEADDKLKLKVINKRIEIKDFVDTKYSGNNTFDNYFRNAFTNIEIYKYL